MFNDKITVSVKGNIGFMESKVLPSGTEVTNFSVAINDSYKDRQGNKVEETNYVNCSAYGKTSELMNRFCKAGTRILLENQPIKFGKDKETGKANGQFNAVVQIFEVLKNGKSKEESQGNQQKASQQNQDGYQQPQQNNSHQQGGYQQSQQAPQSQQNIGRNQQQPNPRQPQQSQYMDSQ